MCHNVIIFDYLENNWTKYQPMWEDIIYVTSALIGWDLTQPQIEYQNGRFLWVIKPAVTITIKPLVQVAPNPKNLNVSCILLQLSLLNPLKPGVKLRMKM